MPDLDVVFRAVPDLVHVRSFVDVEHVQTRDGMVFFYGAETSIAGLLFATAVVNIVSIAPAAPVPADPAPPNRRRVGD